MNIKKLKSNPKKLKKMKVEQLLEIFKLSNEELKAVIEQTSKDELEKYANEEVLSWEKFVEEVSNIIDSKSTN